MGCASCREKRERFNKLMEEKKRELQSLSNNKNDSKNPKQQRIEERNKRIAERNRIINSKRDSVK